MWSMDGFRQRNVGPQIFDAYGVLIFMYSLVVGAARTADCLSCERRDGTLGLLFLTNLNSAEIVLGKLCSTALGTICSLVSIFPMLALPLLLGGTTFGHFWLTVLALINTIFFSLVVGLVASALCLRQATAVTLAIGLALLFGAGPTVASAMGKSFGKAGFWTAALPIVCPYHALAMAKGTIGMRSNHYWLSLALVFAMSLVALGFVMWRIARTWQDQTKTAPNFRRIAFWRRGAALRNGRDIALRRRLLEINPFFWLGGRQQISSPIFTGLVVVLLVLATRVASEARLGAAGPVAPLAGAMLTWLATGVILHALVFYYAAMISSQRLAEDKEAGALELVLCTPTTVTTISRGLWLAFGRRMFFPALMAILTHLFFAWVMAIVILTDPPSKIPNGITPIQLLWKALLNQSVSGVSLDWQIQMLVNVVFCFLAMAVGVWITLGWVGRWLGLTMKRPGFAPLAALGLVLIPPFAVFCGLCYLLGELGFFRENEDLWLPFMSTTAKAVGITWCGLSSWWAARSFRREFRNIASSRYQSLVTRRRRPTRRGLTCFALGTLGTVAMVGLLIAGFYFQQDWKSRRAWAAFQANLEKRGESLDFAALMPVPVPEAENFARSTAFKNLLTNREGAAKKMFAALAPFLVPESQTPIPNRIGAEWTQQQYASLADRATWLKNQFPTDAATNRIAAANILLSDLRAYDSLLYRLALASQLPSLQFATNRELNAIFNTASEHSALEQLHALFQLRASACLATARTSEAAEDLLTCLRLAELSRQLPDVQANLRTQFLLTRSLQPLWEGLVENRWNEPQLATFQAELSKFHLLAEYTNAIPRLVAAHIALWRAIPDDGTAAKQAQYLGNHYNLPTPSTLQPRSWWFDRCIRLHHAGQNSIARMHVAEDRVGQEVDWSDQRGLPLEGSSAQLLQQYVWMGIDARLVSYAQTVLNEAIFACALERHRLTHGQLPEDPAELVPHFLSRIPCDPVRGLPLFYQRLTDQRFILRGVGPNQVDDRKKAVSDDWLWASPTNAPLSKK